MIERIVFTRRTEKIQLTEFFVGNSILVLSFSHTRSVSITSSNSLRVCVYRFVFTCALHVKSSSTFDSTPRQLHRGFAFVPRSFLLFLLSPFRRFVSTTCCFFFYSFLHLVSLSFFIFTFFKILFISKSGAPVHVRIFSRARLRRLSVRPHVNNLAYKLIYFRSRFRVSRYLVCLIVNVVTIPFFRCIIRLSFISPPPSLSLSLTLYFLDLNETSLADVFLFFFFRFDTYGF